MKKIISVIFVVFMLFSLCACAVEKVPTSDDQQAAAAAEQGNKEYGFVYNGTRVAPGMDVSGIAELINASDGSFDEPSCASDGIDKVYFYKSFQVCCFPEGDTYRVYSITLLDDTVSTEEGLCIGDSYDKMISLYGSDPKVEGVKYSYTKGNSTVSFTVEDNVVTSIGYLVII